MAKENYIKFRCSDDFKDLVEQQAKERGMTVSSYIKHLIRKDVDVMRVVYDDFITDEMEEAFKEMDKEEVSTISLEVRVTNEPAIKFYEKIGFKKITIKEHYYDDGEDAIYMVKGGTNIWDNQ